MTAKEYLSQVQEQQNKILEQEEYIQRLRATLDVAGIRYDKERVQTSPDPDKMAHTFSKIFEQEEILENMKKVFVDFRIKVIDMIHQIENDIFRKILNIVYIDGKNLKECAKDIGFSYDYVREMHIQALSAFDEKFPQ